MSERIKWAVNRQSGPNEEALSTEDAKTHLRITHADDDDYIAGLVTTWREWLEEQTSRTLVKTTWKLTQDEFPEGDDPIELPQGPVTSVTSVQYTTATATSATTLSATGYFVDTEHEPGRIAPVEDETWPTDRLREQNGVEVTYEAGFATSATGVPQRAKHALRLLVGNSYVQREGVLIGSISKRVEFSAKALMDQLDASRYM